MKKSIVFDLSFPSTKAKLVNVYKSNSDVCAMYILWICCSYQFKLHLGEVSWVYDRREISMLMSKTMQHYNSL